MEWMEVIGFAFMEWFNLGKDLTTGIRYLIYIFKIQRLLAALTRPIGLTRKKLSIAWRYISVR